MISTTEMDGDDNDNNLMSFGDDNEDKIIGDWCDTNGDDWILDECDEFDINVSLDDFCIRGFFFDD